MVAGVSITDKQRVLEVLKDRKPHTHKELYRLGLIAHSRVADLRDDGYEITCHREGRFYVYQLRALPEADATLATGEGTAGGPSASVSGSALLEGDREVGPNATDEESPFTSPGSASPSRSAHQLSLDLPARLRED